MRNSHHLQQALRPKDRHLMWSFQPVAQLRLLVRKGLLVLLVQLGHPSLAT